MRRIGRQLSVGDIKKPDKKPRPDADNIALGITIECRAQEQQYTEKTDNDGGGAPCAKGLAKD